MGNSEILKIADYLEILLTDEFNREQSVVFYHLLLKYRFPKSSNQELKKASQYYLRRVERAARPKSACGESFRSILKDIGIGASPSAIKYDLELQGFKVTSVTQMQKWSTGEPLPHFLVEFSEIPRRAHCLTYVINNLVKMKPIQKAPNVICRQSSQVGQVTCDSRVNLRCIECSEELHVLLDCPQYVSNSRIIQSNNERSGACKSGTDHQLQAFGRKPPPKVAQEDVPKLRDLVKYFEILC